MNEWMSPPESIVLIGFMGSGKTTVGRALQHRLGFPFLDMDHEIEHRQGKAVAEIFAQQGEAAFRDMETALLRELHDTRSVHRIISTGGGIIGREENRDLLRGLGYVVWLNTTEEVILERTSRNRARPLLQTENPAEKIHSLMALRLPFYQECAHLKLDTSNLDSSELAMGILECARYFFTKHP